MRQIIIPLLDDRPLLGSKKHLLPVISAMHQMPVMRGKEVTPIRLRQLRHLLQRQALRLVAVRVVVPASVGVGSCALEGVDEGVVAAVWWEPGGCEGVVAAVVGESFADGVAAVAGGLVLDMGADELVGSVGEV